MSKDLRKLTIYYCPNGEHGLVGNGILARNVTVIYFRNVFVNSVLFLIFLYLFNPDILSGFKVSV